MKTVALITISTLLAAGWLRADEPEEEKGPVTHLDAAAAEKFLTAEKPEKEEKPIVLDIRTPAEFKEGHLEGAKNIDFLAEGFADKVAKLDREKPYVVY